MSEMPTSNSVVCRCCRLKCSLPSRDHSNSYFYWLFIFMLR